MAGVNTTESGSSSQCMRLFSSRTSLSQESRCVRDLSGPLRQSSACAFDVNSTMRWDEPLIAMASTSLTFLHAYRKVSVSKGAISQLTSVPISGG